MSNAKFVTAGKPKKGGAIFRAPLGTVLPSTAEEALNEAFKNMGYISEDGLKNSNSPESSSVKAWGGDTVLETQTEKPDKFGFTMIEAFNINVLKAVYGDENVTESTSADENGGTKHSITIKANSTEQEECCWVIDMILKNGAAKRIVIPDAKVIEVGEITYGDEDPVGYETTISAVPDTDGQTHYEYITYTSKE